MPRTLQEILDQQHELAAMFENYEPKPEDERDVVPLKRAQAAVQARIEADRELAAAVAALREAGYSWATIGGIVGTTGEAARQRYGSRSSPRASEKQSVAAIAVRSVKAVETVNFRGLAETFQSKKQGGITRVALRPGEGSSWRRAGSTAETVVGTASGTVVRTPSRRRTR